MRISHIHWDLASSCRHLPKFEDAGIIQRGAIWKDSKKKKKCRALISVLTLPCWAGERDATGDRWENKWLTNEKELGWHALTGFVFFFPPEPADQKCAKLQTCQLSCSAFTFCHSGSAFVFIFHVRRSDFQFRLFLRSISYNWRVNQQQPSG